MKGHVFDKENKEKKHKKAFLMKDKFNKLLINISKPNKSRVD